MPDQELASDKELAATLVFVDGDLPMDKLGGIYSVGDYHFPHGSKPSVQLRPGWRIIGYSCPGYVTLDAVPTIGYHFQGGRTYEIYCIKGSAWIREQG